MIISKAEGNITGFQWMDPQIGVEAHVVGVREWLFPFMPEKVDEGKIDVAKYKFKKVRITVELIDND